MAIVKERLQELIEQGATVFSIFPGRVIDGKPMTIQLSDKCEIYNGKLYVGSWEYCGDYNMLYLYEHKADAEWDLEFGKGRLTRTEELNLPRYSKAIVYTFKDRQNQEYELRMFEGGNITLWKTLNMDKLFNKETSRENYTEACRLIKKLFMGEA